MKNKILALAFLMTPAIAFAQSTSNGVGQSSSDSGAFASTGNLNFEAAQPLRHQRVDTTPSVYPPTAMISASQQNCSAGTSFGASFTGFGFGGGSNSESPGCEARLDAAPAWQMGMKEAAMLRFFCYGQPANKKAYLAAGKSCPGEATQVAASHRDPNQLYIGG